MQSRKITEGDIAHLKISALPTRPTAPTEFGGKGYTPKELKAAFDALPLFIIEMYNALIDDVKSGRILEEVTVEGTDLKSYIQLLRSDLDTFMSEEEE